jgi:hypothetical protein
MLDGSHAALWLTVVALGVYHGLNPAMGWPLAVANGLSARRGSAVFATAGPLGLGHFLAMAVVLLPFALLAWMVEWSREIRIATGLVVFAFGVYRLIDRRHPRFLARIKPTQLTWWSFLMATAHGAGLMLVPVALGLCSMPREGGHAAMEDLMRDGIVIAASVALVHALAMLLAGLSAAWVVYRYLGLAYLRRAWFNLDVVWAASLVVAGAIGVGSALVL